MSYATCEDFDCWAYGVTALEIQGLDGLLARASMDIDAYLAWPAPTEAGTRIDVSTLTHFQQQMLVRATVLQAVHRYQVDEEDIAVGAPRVVSIPGGITFAQTAPDWIGYDTFACLAGTGLLKRSGTAAPPA